MAPDGNKRKAAPLGVHTSIAGGRQLAVDRAVELGCTAMQIFGRNPRSWAFSPVPAHEAALFREKRAQESIWPVAVHTTYLINLCSPADELFDKSVDLFKGEISIAADLGADYLVTHLGSPGGLGAEYAVERVLEALEKAASIGVGGAGGAGALPGSVEILLENTSGAGAGFGANLDEIGRVLDGAARIGIKAGLCFDTCHGFAAGYPFGSVEDAGALVAAIDASVGLERLKLIHLNDSKGESGSRLDRHEHIGKGRIGATGLANFLNHPKIRGIPLILETPKKSLEDDPGNLRAVRRILKGDI